MSAPKTKTAPERAGEPRPFAWARGVYSPSTPNGPAEYDYDMSVGDDRPDGDDWFPLYRETEAEDRAYASGQAEMRAVIEAWESLPGGNHSPREIEHWLITRMKPAIDRLRSLEPSSIETKGGER